MAEIGEKKVHINFVGGTAWKNLLRTTGKNMRTSLRENDDVIRYKMDGTCLIYCKMADL